MRFLFVLNNFMKQFTHILIVAISTIVIFSNYLYAEVIHVCNSCGYELTPPIGNFCSNCGSATGVQQTQTTIPEVATDTPSSTTQQPQQQAQPHDISNLQISDAEFEIVFNAAQFYFKSGLDIVKSSKFKKIQDNITAFIYLNNAEGLFKILPLDKYDTENYIQQIEAVKTKIFSVVPYNYNSVCPCCNGEGFVDFKYLLPDGKIGTKQNSLSCPVCKERKTYPSVISNDILARCFAHSLFEVNEASSKNEYTQKLVELQIISTRLTVPQQATLLKATTLPCEGCYGFRIEPCRSCRGFGMSRCRDRNCDDGYKSSRHQSRRSSDVVSIESQQLNLKCENCDGTTFISCPDCSGRGTSICHRCQGTGRKNICDSCTGMGYEECQRCKNKHRGYGHNTRECRNCGDTRLVLCETCDGSGVK